MKLQKSKQGFKNGKTVIMKIKWFFCRDLTFKNDNPNSIINKILYFYSPKIKFYEKNLLTTHTYWPFCTLLF